MNQRKLFILFIAFVFAMSTWLSAGSFLETANQAKESGKVCKTDDSKKNAGKGEGNQGKGDREKDSPSDHDNGKGNDDKDSTKFQGKPPVDPDDPSDNPEVDETGNQCPAKVKNLGAKDLVKLIFVKFQVKVVGGCLGEGSERDGNLWTQGHLWELYKSFYSLPKFFFGKNFEVRRTKVGCNNPNVTGYVATGTRCIFICDAAIKKGAFSDTVVKEVGRCTVSDNEFREVKDKWMKLFWHDNGKNFKTRPPSSCECQHPHEDFAESLRLFRACGQWFKAKDQARYEFIKSLVMKGREYRGRNCGACGCDSNNASIPPGQKPAPTPTPSPTPKPTTPAPTPKPPQGNNPGPSGNNGGGDHGASGKPDQNPKNNPNNPGPGTQPGQSGGKSGGNAGNNSGGNKGNNGGGDHGASGKTDQNPKNNPNNPGPGTAPGSSSGNNGSNSGGNNGNGGNTGNNSNNGGNAGGNSGGGDHGASGKTDQNTKNNPNNPGPGTTPGSSSGNNGSNSGGNNGKK